MVKWKCELCEPEGGEGVGGEVEGGRVAVPKQVQQTTALQKYLKEKHKKSSSFKGIGGGGGVVFMMAQKM